MKVSSLKFPAVRCAGDSKLPHGVHECVSMAHWCIPALYTVLTWILKMN